MDDLNELTIFCDGGARGNPGPAAAGVVVKTKSKETVERFGKYLGYATNNEAEYQGVIYALHLIIDRKYKPVSVIIKLDSLLVVKQLRNEFKVKEPRLNGLFNKVKNLERLLQTSIAYEHIPRILNAEADEIVNKTLDTKRGT